jgi:hypothetical protein
MNTLELKIDALAIDVFFKNDAIGVVLADGREVCAPLEWFPRLLNATDDERIKWRLIGGGIGIHWESIDEDISIECLLAVR